MPLKAYSKWYLNEGFQQNWPSKREEKGDRPEGKRNRHAAKRKYSTTRITGCYGAKENEVMCLVFLLICFYS